MTRADSLEVRRAQSDSDFSRLYEIFVVYEADLPENLRHGSVPDAADLKAAYTQQNAAFLAMRDDETIGCVALTQRNPCTSVVLRHLFVKPKDRARGTARALVCAAIRFAREKGSARVVLDTHKGELPAAYRLYHSLGFDECAPEYGTSYDSPTFMQLLL